jgi:hypothetical protein
MSRIINPNEPPPLQPGQGRAVWQDGNVVLQQCVIVTTAMTPEMAEGFVAMLQQAIDGAKAQRALIRSVIEGNGATG